MQTRTIPILLACLALALGGGDEGPLGVDGTPPPGDDDVPAAAEQAGPNTFIAGRERLTFPARRWRIEKRIQ